MDPLYGTRSDDELSTCREGQKVLVHIVQDLFYFKDFHGRDVEHSASKQAKIPGNIVTRTNSMCEDFFRNDMNAKNGNESHLRLSLV